MPNVTALARHALGLEGSYTQSYRNRYIAQRGSEAFDLWQHMVDIGHAKLSDARCGFESRLFYLTRKGAEAVLRPGESLDPEDFPPPEAAE